MGAVVIGQKSCFIGQIRLNKRYLARAPVNSFWIKILFRGSSIIHSKLNEINCMIFE